MRGFSQKYVTLMVKMREFFCLVGDMLPEYLCIPPPQPMGLYYWIIQSHIVYCITYTVFLVCHFISVVYYDSCITALKI